MMKDKVKKYGMHDWQIEKLLNDGEIDTTHGVYILEGNRLFLKQDGNRREVEL